MMSTVALPPELETALSRIERQLESISTAVGQGDTVALEALSGNLRQIVVDFSGLVEGRHEAFASIESQQRLKKVAQNLASQREGLIRRSASVERALHALIPAMDAATYVQPAASPSYSSGRKRYEA